MIKLLERMHQTLRRSSIALWAKLVEGAVKGLGIAGAGLDAFLNYRKNRNQGDSRLKSGLKSGFRTSAGWLGGAAGSTLVVLLDLLERLVVESLDILLELGWQIKFYRTTKKNREKKSKEVTIMYYNYSEEQKYFLSVTDAMLKDDYSVEEILEFWNCDDEEQVEGILSSLILTESVDYSNPELLIVCERIGLLLVDC